LYYANSIQQKTPNVNIGHYKQTLTPQPPHAAPAKKYLIETTLAK